MSSVERSCFAEVKNSFMSIQHMFHVNLTSVAKVIADFEYYCHTDFENQWKSMKISVIRYDVIINMGASDSKGSMQLISVTS